MFAKILGMFPKMLLALGVMIPFSQAAVVQAPQAIQNIVGQDWGGCGNSATTYMDSHREQRHSFVTSDGGIHILYNTGATDGNALQICSSFDNGKTWATTYKFSGTSSLSTDDLLLGGPGPSGTPLQVTYDVSATGVMPAVVYVVLLYTNGVFTLQTSQTVATNPKVKYTEPAFAVDAGGNIWLAVETLNTTNGNQLIVMHYQAVGSTTWSSPVITFPNPNTGQGANGIVHAPRPVYIPSSIGNVGMLYQSYNCLYWVTISGNKVSTVVPLSCSLPTSQTSVLNTAYSVVTDPVGNQYLGYVISAGGGSEIYTRTYIASQGTWSSGQALTQAAYFNSAIYVKTSYLTTQASSTYASMLVSNKGALALYVSGSVPMQGSTNYTLKSNLTHATATSTSQNYTNPRIDAPEYMSIFGTSTMPVWEQYTYNASSTQSFIYWPMPINW